MAMGCSASRGGRGAAGRDGAAATATAVPIIDPVGVTIHAVRRQGWVIAVPFLVVCWLVIAWKAGVFTPRSG